jgi:phosphoenolpyruvate carboxylase
MLEMVFAKTDAGISAYYDERLVPEELRRIGDSLREQLASDMATVLEIGGGEQLLASEPWIGESLRLRNIYTEPLNMLQAELLRRNREAAEPWLERAIMVTIAGIAAGMRNTG